MSLFFMPKISFNKLIIYILVVIVLSVFLIQQHAYVEEDKAPASSNFHLSRALQYYDTIVSGGLNHLETIWYPPLVYLITLPVFIINGVSAESAKIVLMLFAVILLLSMYGIGRELGGETAGVITMIITASSPAVLELSRRFFLDFPQTAMTALALYGLIKTNSFNCKKWSVIFGIFLALAMLTKWSTAFFTAFPILWIFLSLIKNGIKEPIKLFLTLIYLGTVLYLVVHYFAVPRSPSIWLNNYLLIIVLPSVLWGVLIFAHDKFFANKKSLQSDKEAGSDDDNKENSKEQEDKVSNPSSPCPIVNFGIFSAIFFIIMFPWYFWAARALTHNIINDYHYPRSFMDNFNTVVNYLVYGMNLFPVLQIFAVIGLIIMVLRYRHYVSKSVFYHIIPINLVFVTLFMCNFGFQYYRYYLSLVIFLAILAGFWTEKLGRLKAPVVLVLLAAYGAVAFSWIIIPKINHRHIKYLYKTADFGIKFSDEEQELPLLKLTWLREPRGFPAKIDPLMDAIADFPEQHWKPVMIFLYPGVTPELREYIQLQAYINGYKIDPFFNTIELERYGKEYQKGYVGPLFMAKHITAPFISRIKKAEDVISLYVNKSLSEESRLLMEDYSNSHEPSLELKQAFAKDLNKILLVKEPLNKILPIQVNKRKLPSEIRNKTHIEGETLVCLNRMIFDQLFEEELHHRFNPDPYSYLSAIDFVMIIYLKNQNPQKALIEVERFFPHSDRAVLEIPFSEKYKIVGVKLNRKGILPRLSGRRRY